MIPKRMKKLTLWTALIVLMALGVALLVVPEVADGLPRVWKDISTALGTAFLIAGILGASVDRWLKRELLRDAYQTLFGYLLPDDLRNELAWVADQKLLAERLDLRLTFGTSDDAGLLRLHIDLQADIHNISSETVPYKPLFAVDEWFHPGGGRSSVTSLRATMNGKTYSDMDVHQDDPFAIGGRLPELSLKPDERVTLVAEGEETRRISDAYLLHLSRATPRPRVSVRAPEGIDYRVMFGNREQGQVRAIGEHTVALPGTLLPGQVIQIRWWPTDAKSGGGGHRAVGAQANTRASRGP